MQIVAHKGIEHSSLAESIMHILSEPLSLLALAVVGIIILGKVGKSSQVKEFMKIRRNKQ